MRKKSLTTSGKRNFKNIHDKENNDLLDPYRFETTKKKLNFENTELEANLMDPALQHKLSTEPPKKNKKRNLS